MKYIKITKDNIEKEHICCAISNDNDIQVVSKKEWIKSCLKDGLVFLKSVERGKCFIEYIKAENAWVPISAKGYIYIDCLWVSGSFKGHGYSNDLLNECIKDAKSSKKIGICILSSEKKKSFLSDPKYLKYKGFEVADRTENGIELWYLPLKKNAEKPKFKSCAKQLSVKDKGFLLYYTNQCPFNAKYVPILEEVAKKNKIKFKAIKLQDKKEAQNAPTPITTYSLFYNGKYVTHERMNDKMFLKLVEECCK